MNVETLTDLFVVELHRAYAMENRLAEELAKLAEDAGVDALDDRGAGAVREAVQEAIADHRDQTERQAERLEGALAALDRPEDGRSTPALDGLIKEKELFNNVVLNDELRPVYYLDVARGIERLEITAYERLLRLADHLDVPEEAVEAIEQNLEEEEATLAELESIGDDEAIGALLEKLPPTPGHG